MASNLRVDTILPSTGTNVAIGTASGSVTFLGDTDITTSGSVSIGGTLTYEDVTNVDSVGVITARGGIRIGGGTTVGPISGIVTYFGDGSQLTGITAGTSLSGSTNNTVCTVTGANAIQGESNVQIDSNGRLLIGTANVPSNKNTVTPSLNVSGSGVNGAAQITRHTSVGGGGALLHLSGTRGSDVNSYTILQSGDGIGTLSFQGADGNEFVQGAAIQANVDGTPGDNDMPGRLGFFVTADGASTSTERMRIQSDGEVFIGANLGGTNRSTLLSVSGANQNPTGVWSQVGVYSNDSVAQDKGGSIGFGGHDGSVAQQQFSAIKGAKENGNSGDYAGYLAVYTRPSGSTSVERVRIKSNGVVDINGMFCAGKPGNFGSVSSTQGCRITGQQGSHPAALSFDGGGTPTLELGSTSGQTIIGSNSYASSPMNFKSGMAIGTLGGGTTRFQINSNGNIGAPTGNNIYNASDERLKENMVELTDGLSKIQKLKPISFTWKEGWDVNLDGKKEYGFGAQTTEAVDEMLVEPFSLVDAELNGEIIEKPLRVNEKYIIPLLVKAVQELSAEVAALKSS